MIAPRRKHRRPRRFAETIIGDDGLDVGRIGGDAQVFGDLYHRLTRMSWPWFIACFVGVFVAINLVFAGLFLLDPGGLSGDDTMRVRSPFLRAFFFSVHTVATVGYGNVVPASIYANVVVVCEIVVGILVVALTSGLMFARFARPRARVLFSRVAVIRPFEGTPTLMFRAANMRSNFILEASVKLSVLRYETHDGREMRRFYDLALIRDVTPVFSMSWLVMHRIDETSPLYGIADDAPADGRDEFVVLLTGVDSSVVQSVHARHAYGSEDVLIDHDFVDVLSMDRHGRRWIDFRKFHDTVALAPGQRCTDLHRPELHDPRGAMGL